jgi:hypothetical protein
VANVEGDSPNSDELKAHADESAPVEPGTPEDEAAYAGDAPLDESAEGEQPEMESAEEAEPEEAEAEPEEKPFEVPAYLEWAGVIGVPLVILAIAALCVMTFATALAAFSLAVYVIALAFIPYGLWKGRETNNIYTVVLGCALAALLTMTYCLWRELGEYQFNIKARRQVGMSSQNLQLGPASTTAAAWPAVVRLTNRADGLEEHTGSPAIT